MYGPKREKLTFANGKLGLQTEARKAAVRHVNKALGFLLTLIRMVAYSTGYNELNIYRLCHVCTLYKRSHLPMN